MLPRTYPKAIAERACRELLRTGAIESADPARVTLLLERAIEEELAVETKLREEAQSVLDAHRSEVKGAHADVDLLREKIVHKLARDRGLVLR